MQIFMTAQWTCRLEFVFNAKIIEKNIEFLFKIQKNMVQTPKNNPDKIFSTLEI